MRKGKSVKHSYALAMAAGLCMLSASNTSVSAESVVTPLNTLNCIVQPSDIVEVGAPVSGLIERIYFDRSDSVSKGDKLVQLHADVEKLDTILSSSRAETNTAIELRKAALTLDYKTKTRNEKLMKSSMISEQEVDQLDTDIRIAELNLKLENEQKAQAKIVHQRTKALLEQKSVSSPITGVVVQRYKSVGERVDDDPILKLAQLDPLHVEVIVPIENLAKIKLGMTGRVTPSIAESEQHTATVVRIDKVMDAASGTFGVRLSLPNPDYAIPAGVLCQLDLS